MWVLEVGLHCYRNCNVKSHHH